MAEVYAGHLTEAKLPENDHEDGYQTLSNTMEDYYRTAVHHKESLCVTERLRRSWFAINQKYTPEMLCKLKKEKSADVFYGLTSLQRASGLSWYEDLMSQSKSKPWTIKPTPIAKLPPEARDEIINQVTRQLIDGTIPNGSKEAKEAITRESELTRRLMQQRAESAAARMDRLCHDQLAEGGWDRAFAEFRGDLFTYPNAFLMSPEVVNDTVLEYTAKGVTSKDKTVYKVRAVSPFAVFPMPDCTGTQDGTGVFVVEEMSRNALVGVRSDKNSREDAINDVLENYKDGWWAGDLVGNKDLEQAEGGYYASRSLAGSNAGSKTYSVIRFFGDIDPEDALKAGLIKKKEAKGKSVAVEIWFCGGQIIRIARNQHPKAMRPLHTASYRSLPRSFWGFGLYDILADKERLINKSLRELVAHTATSLGYFGEIDMARMGRNPVGDKIPLNSMIKIDQDYTRGGHGALKFHSLESKITQVISLINFYANEAENLTGIRKFMSGATDLGVAGRTNGVMNALQVNSSKIILSLQGEVNNTVLKPVVQYLFDLNMVFSKDKTIRGDLQVVIEGTDGIAKKEVFDQKLEKLLQYGTGLISQPAPDGRPWINVNDLRQMIGEYFRNNGQELSFTLSPSEQAGIGAEMQGQVGSGGFQQIDGRSNPVQMNGAQPIPAQA